MTAPAPWFDLSDLVWIGPLGGGLEFAWSATLVLFSFYLVRKGRGRPWVFGHAAAGVAAGAVLSVAGAAAVAQGQPYPIFVTLLALGVPLLVTAAFNFWAVHKAYQLIELRRMQALEL
jgi:hypothetical protein